MPSEIPNDVSTGSQPCGSDDEVLERLLSDRWSCRAFLPQSLPDAILLRLLSIAQRAPSWCNTQPWTVRVTSGQATEDFRRSLMEHVRQYDDLSNPDYEMPAQFTGVRQDRRRAQGWQLYEAVGVARGDRAASAQQAFRNFELFGAPHVAIITTAAEMAAYGALDTGIYVGTWLLAAQSLGVAAVPQAALAGYAPFLRQYFGIPDDERVLLAISFGYPDLSHPVNAYRTARASLKESVILMGS